MDLIISPAARNVLVIGFIAAIVFYAVQYNDQIAQDQKQAASQQTAQPVAMTKDEVLSHVKIEDVKVGKGAEAKIGDKVTVNYEGTLDNGQKFDSSYDRKEPFVFTLGGRQVIPGWDVGVQGMKVGGTRKLIIDPTVAYGPRAVGPIPPNATLHFTVELVKVN